MGFDGLISFLIRNLPNEAFDEINLKINFTKVVSNHVLIDISFILYNCYIIIENEINDIIKKIAGLSCNNYNKIISSIEEQLNSTLWKDLNIVLDGNTKEEIIQNFVNNFNNVDTIHLLLSKYITFKLKEIITHIFELQFINSIVLFFDSIPPYSKILEQRKRRLKNYKDSIDRKNKCVNMFSTLTETIMEENNINYEYFMWIKNKFSCHKVIDSNSQFVKFLKDYISKNFKINNTNIVIDNDSFGEADYKIFKYISKNNISNKSTILSCDSDLLYQVLLQNYNYKVENKNITLFLLKFYLNSFDYCQLFNGNYIINYINNLYLTTNNIKLENTTFCYDLLFLFNLFGSDILPNSLEFGPEINFTIIMKTHYNSLFDINTGKIKYIINITKENNIVKKSVDYNNLTILFKNLISKKTFSKIILLRHYKVPYSIVTILIDVLNLNLLEVRDKLLEPYLIYKGYLYSQDSSSVILDDNDIRKILYNKYKDNPSKIFDPLNKKFYPDVLDSYINQLEILLENYLDFEDIGNYGLLNNSFSLELESNIYQTIYSYIKDKKNIKENFINFDYIIPESDNKQVENYLLVLQFIVNNFFNDMKNYKSTNTINYNYKCTPGLSSIVNYLENIDTNKLHDNLNNIISKNIIEPKYYFNSVIHHFIITPYLLDSNYIEHLSNKVILKKISNNFDEDLKKIWEYQEEDNFYKEDPLIILKKWNNLLYNLDKDITSDLIIEI